MNREIGMCPTMDDKDFYVLLTNNGKENVELVIKHYPELEYFSRIKEFEPEV